MGFISFGNNEIAKNVAKILVKNQLVACAKVMSNIESFYLWEGNLQEDNEFYLIIKTKENKVEEIKKILDENHNYKVYEFNYYQINVANEKYALWMDDLLDSSSKI